MEDFIHRLQLSKGAGIFFCGHSVLAGVASVSPSLPRDARGRGSSGSRSGEGGWPQAACSSQPTLDGDACVALQRGTEKAASDVPPVACRGRTVVGILRCGRRKLG